MCERQSISPTIIKVEDQHVLCDDESIFPLDPLARFVRALCLPTSLLYDRPETHIY